MCTDHHAEQSEVEQRTACHSVGVESVFFDHEDDAHDETGEECQAAEASEEVHRAFAELRDESDGEQIEVTP